MKNFWLAASMLAAVITTSSRRAGVSATTLSPAERRRALAVVYLLVSAPAWQAMRDQWGLEGEESGKAAAWAVRVLTDELRRNPASIKEVDDDDHRR